jgi:anti-sigma regulatory factor (Ser/Thr protein kinase)
VETSVTFPGLAAIVPSARRLVRGVLADSPRADDMELIASELVSNAIRHTPAGHPGGEFTVTVRTGPDWARVEVSDTGSGEWHPDPDGGSLDDEYGRGLAIIAAVADKFGHTVDASGQIVWAEVCWTARSPIWSIGVVGRDRRRRTAALARNGRRPKAVQFSLTYAEFDEISEAAASAGLARGAFAAEVTLAAARGAQARAASPLREAWAELMEAAGLARRIGTNLNQAVARLNATGQRGEDLLPSAEFCVRVIHRMDEATCRFG